MTSSHPTFVETPVLSQKLLSLFALICCVAVQFFVTGCDATNSQPSTGGPLSGNWQITLQNGTASRSQSGFVLQAGKTIGGQFLLTGDCAGIGTVQGEVNGANVSLTVNQPAQTIGLEGYLVPFRRWRAGQPHFDVRYLRRAEHHDRECQRGGNGHVDHHSGFAVLHPYHAASAGDLRECATDQCERWSGQREALPEYRIHHRHGLRTGHNDLSGH